MDLQILVESFPLKRNEKYLSTLSKVKHFDLLLLPIDVFADSFVAPTRPS